MAITEKAVDQAFAELRETHGGVRDDYYGLLYLMQEHRLERERALSQLAIGGNEYGIDAFHFDGDKRNLYLYQFKYSKSYAPFKESIATIINVGMEKVFGSPDESQRPDPLLRQIHGCLLENEAVIDRVLFGFVFIGDPVAASNSAALDKLCEDLTNKKYLAEQRFQGKAVSLLIDFCSDATRIRWQSVIKRNTHEVPLDRTISRPGPGNERMTVGFMRLLDLQAMYRAMGVRFFERNIRSSLSEEEAVNRAIQRSFTRAVIEGREDPRNFAFNHNGVTLSAVKMEEADGKVIITEPRLLNGAQTVTTFDRFVKAHEGEALAGRQEALDSLSVMCRIITGASPEFITSVTINNNRQNPVDPANLHANDMIQLEIQDKLLEDLGIYYERQEKAFSNLTDDDLEEMKIKEGSKAVELTLLAKTFIISDGEIDRLNNFRDVFEDEELYNRVFSKDRLGADFRKVVLCYKLQFRLRKLANDIVERGASKYAYLQRARNILWALLCQGILNDENVEQYAQEYGRSLSLETPFTDWLSSIATGRCRFILSDLMEDKQFADKASEGSYSFMRTQAACRRAMEIASKRYGWAEKRLGGAAG